MNYGVLRVCTLSISKGMQWTNTQLTLSAVMSWSGRDEAYKQEEQ